MSPSVRRSSLQLAFYLALAAALAWAAGANAQGAGSRALLLTFDGPLTPAMADYLERGLRQAQTDPAELVVLQLNTPGGQITLMERMISAIRNSPVPVVVYVTPRGAIAGSAGTLITLAGHASGMAPETAIGAASPVGGQGEDLEETIAAKEKEALRALARALANRRGAVASALAEATIESAKAVTAEEALAAGLVDVIAQDVPALLRQLDERIVEVNGQPRPLLTRNLLVSEVPMTLIETLLNLLTNPNLVFLLLSFGSLLIYIEIQTPGGWVAGLLGAGCLLLAFYGLGVLPVNWFGLIFIGLAFGLFIAELNTPTTFGALTAAGGICLVIGALVLFNSPGSLPFFRVNVPLVVISTVVLAALSLAVVGFALRSARRPVLVGTHTLIGQAGEMRTGDSAQVGSELWSVEPENGPLHPGDPVEVTAVKGLKLRVRRRA